MIDNAIKDDYVKVREVSPVTLSQCRPYQAEYQGQLWARLKTLKMMGIPTPTYVGFDPDERLWR